MPKARARATPSRCRTQLFAEMKGRIKEDDSIGAEPGRPLCLFTRYREGGQHPLSAASRAAAGGEESPARRRRARGRQGLLPASAARSTRPTIACSPGRRDDAGSEFDTLRVRDLASGADLADVIPDVGRRGGVDARTASAFYYVRLDENHRPLARLSASPRHAGRG